jgi:glutathione reductase (NADPH)
MAEYDFDLIVIGGGSAGVRLARWSGGLGAKVAIIEEAEFGGTCVVRGCIPKKMMSLGAHFPHEIEVMKDYGWQVGSVSLDFAGFREAREKEIARLSGLYQGMLKNNNVEVVAGRAEVVGENSVKVGDRAFTAKHIAIAVGGRPSLPDLPGIEHTITSNEAFQLSDVPDSIVVVGTGYIGVEFAGIFNGFGSKVTVLCRKDSVLTGFDDDIRYFLHQQMQEKGIETKLAVGIEKIEKLENGMLNIVLNDGSSVEAEHCLMATGRRPNTARLGLESVGVQTKESGAVIINERYESSVPSILALGDCTDRVNLTPVATAEGMVVAERLFADGKRQLSYDCIPTAVFSDPPVATVGLTETEARESFQDIRVFKSSFRNLKFTLSEGGEKTFMKLVVDAKSDKVVGCHMAGKDAPEIVQGVAIAIKAGATKAVFDSTIGIHPTSAEEFVTMRG